MLGASGHAKVVLDILHRQRLYEVAALLDKYKPVGSLCCGHEVVETPLDLREFFIRHSISGVIVAIGDNWTRGSIVNQIRDACPGIELVTAIHPSAQVASGVEIGPVTVIMAGAAVNPEARIGESCILNTRSSLDHDSIMKAYSSLGPAATTGGGVRVGSYSNVGIGATVVQEVTIGKHVVISADAAVFKSIPDEVVAYGTPARVIRGRKPGDLGELPIRS